MQEEIKKALDVLYSGGILLYPSDTGWAIGCDATNEEAVKRLFEIKKCPDAKGLLVLIDNPGKLPSYLDEVPEIAWDLIEMTEKPLTIIYSGVRNLPSALLTKDRSLGIRVTQEAFSKNLCARFRKPIVLTAANLYGMPFPESFGRISDEIKLAVDYVVNFRRDEPTQKDTSSIIKLGKGSVFELIRE